MAAPFDAAPVWSTACPDWERRIVSGESLVPCPPLFQYEAEAGLEVFKSQRIADIPGKPTLGEAGQQWVFDFVSAIFGAYDPSSARQLIREFLLVVSKKNAKSTLAAGVMMTVLILNPRHSAEFLILAPTKEIADNSFDPAADMAELDNEELAREGKAPLFRVYRREKRIVHLGTKAELKVIAADTDTVGGTKATVTLVDELWLFGKRPGAMTMFREATGGLAARPEGFVIYLSTMSDEPPAGEFKAKLQYGRDVRDGKVNDQAFLPVIYEFPPAMLEAKAYRNPANFYITNPNLNASVDVAYLQREFAKAEQAGEAELRDFEAKHLNVEVGLALRSDRWSGADFWQQQTNRAITLRYLLQRCEVVTVGADGGGLDDLFGLCVLGREKDTGHWLAWFHAWAHRIVLNRRKDIAPKLLDFQKDGDLTIVDRPGDDVEQAADLIMQTENAGLLAEAGIGVDAMGIGALVTELERRNIETQKRIAAIRQGFGLNGAIKDTERFLAGGTLWHSGSGLMAWCVGNAKVEPKGNAVLITKSASGSAKIDPLMAGFNAVQLMSVNPQPFNAPSVYEKRGVYVF